MKASPADVRLLSTPTSILILGPSSAFGMPDLKPLSVLSTFELGPNDRHAFSVLQRLRSDTYEMTNAQDYLGKMAGETYTISNTAFNQDPILGLHRHLRSGRLQMIVVDRYHRHATSFTAYAKSGTGHVPLAHPHQPAAKAAASPRLPTPQATPATHAVPPQANVGNWSVEQRLKLLFEDMLPLLGQDLRAYVQSMLTGKALASLVAGIVVMAGLQAIPGVGEIADAAFLGVVWIYAGWDGLRAVPVLVKAVRHAASATTIGEIEAAAPDAARALETLGGDVLAILIARAAKRNTSGGEEAASSAEPGPATQTINSNRGRGVEKRERQSNSSASAKEADANPVPQSGPAIEVGSEEALAAERAYAQSSNTTGTLVIGRIPDTSAGADLGMTRLNEPNWTLNVNDAWIQGGIDTQKPFYLGSNITIGNLRSGNSQYPTTVYFRELQQLRSAGYHKSGDYMLPPPNLK